ncbi:MAG: hypothetical protein ABIP03_14010, partial [Aquihabitans sp.]
VARDQAPKSLSASWLAVVDTATGETLMAGPGAPTADWLAAFVHGARSAVALGGTDAGSSDVIWTPLSTVDLALVAGRDGVVWRSRERRQLESLARIVATRWAEFADQ